MKQASYLVAALFALCVALAAGPAFAQDGGDQKIMTIQEVRGTDNGSEVTFKGKITKELGAGKIGLEDETGPIRAKVEKDLWPGGKRPDDGTEVIISGKLAKRGNSVEVEASKVELVQE